MDTFVKALKDAEKVSTKKEKLEALSSLSEVGKRLIIEGLSAYRVFGVKKFPMPKVYSLTDNSPKIFFELLDNLHNRKITGNSAINAVTNTLSMFIEETAKYLVRVINKNFKAGFSETTVNKIYPGLVPIYEVMLAFPVDESFDWSTWPKLLQIKYDGLRSNAPTTKNGTKYISRSGKDATHLEGLFDEEFAKIREYFGHDIMPDGEAMGADFQESMNAKAKDNKTAKENQIFYIFDLMSMEEWNNQKCVAYQMERTNMIKNICKRLGLKKIVPAYGQMACNRKEAEAFYEEALALGHEGIMIKDCNGYYEWKRSENWWKWKPTETFDGIITGFKEGTKGSKNEGSLGAILVEGETETGVKWSASVGTGFKPDKKLRDEIWNNKNKYIGINVEIKGDPKLSLAEGSNIHSVRWPRFKKFRFDK